MINWFQFCPTRVTQEVINQYLHELGTFSISWIAVIYLFNSALARKLKTIELKTAGLYVSSVALVGVFGEVLLDTFYETVFGTPLWEYHVLPIHDGYTSYYSLAIWGMYGFYLYLLHDNLTTRKAYPLWQLVAIISLEATALEFLFNLSHVLIFGSYIFYYLPEGLWHLSAFQVIPFYFVASLTIIKAIQGFKSDPWFFIYMNIILASVLIFFT